jgi:hypothetical protein
MPWAPDYITTAELKSFLGINDAIDDAQLAIAITAASRAVDRVTNRQFGQATAAEARLYTPKFDTSRVAATWPVGKWVVQIDDLMDATGLTVATSKGAVDLFVKQPVNAAATGKPWTRLVIDPLAAVVPIGFENEVTVTAKFGWAAVPVPVKQATLLQASRFFKRRDAPFGVAGSPELGSELRLLARVDPDVAVTLRPYIRQRLTVG